MNSCSKTEIVRFDMITINRSLVCFSNILLLVLRYASSYLIR